MYSTIFLNLYFISAAVALVGYCTDYFLISHPITPHSSPLILDTGVLDNTNTLCSLLSTQSITLSLERALSVIRAS